MGTAFENVRNTCATVLIALASFHGSAAHATAEVYGSAQCGGTPAGWQGVGGEYQNEASSNAIILKNGRILWNWSPTSDADLNKYMRLVHASPSNMILVFNSHSLCAKVSYLRNLVRRSVRCGQEVACVEYTMASWRASRMWVTRDDRARRK